MNERHNGVCIACGGAETAAAARPAAEPDKPTLTVKVAASPSKASTAPAVPAVTRSAMPARPTPPLSPAAPARATPARPPRPTRPPARRPVRSIRRTRRFAVGRLLGVGHVALFVYATLAVLTHPRWGVRLLNWVDKLTISWGDPVTGAQATSWQNNHLVSDGYTWLSHLPAGYSDNTYFALAIACLFVRLRRSLPGWLSLVVALPAAVYGLAAAVADFPWLAIYWPLSALTLVLAGVLVARTTGR